MSKHVTVHVKKLALDLQNFRTVPQKDEAHALQSIISINPEWFWALTNSLLESGYLPTENVIVLKSIENPAKLVVREGNRRVGALKLILGEIVSPNIEIPPEIQIQIDALPPKWESANGNVPCAIYEASDADTVDRIVTLVHGKGEQAGRYRWNAVARARHARDVSGANEPALDLLEKFLSSASNVTSNQRDIWAGEYPLTILEDGIKRIADRFGVSSAAGLTSKYPNVKHRRALDDIIRDIGMKVLKFKEVRDGDFAEGYGVPAVQAGPPPTQKSSSSSTTTSSSSTTSTKKVAAVPTNDPRGVKRELRAFKPLGGNRGKVVDLVKEARVLDIRKTPLAFCFVLRSMFEISAKAYCADHASSGGPKLETKKGGHRYLADVLIDVKDHIVANSQNQSMIKALHGAGVELKKQDGLLSVTSMNQLVHNPNFSLTAGDICTMFQNIFPLLREMNQ